MQLQLSTFQTSARFRTEVRLPQWQDVEPPILIVGCSGQDRRHQKPRGESCKVHFLTQSARAAVAHLRWPARKGQVYLLQLLRRNKKEKTTTRTTN